MILFGETVHLHTVAISVHTEMSLLCNKTSTFLVVLFFLSNCQKAYFRRIIEKVENGVRPEVTIPQGTVLGVNMVTHHNRIFFGFKGIPFAQPPVGNLRFKGPVPRNPWNGTLDASRDPNECPQLKANVFVGDEDCLYLNVYTPQLPAGENSTLLPVMFFIYGGQFQTGTNSARRWGPEFILNKDVILVVPNYRLGVLGYLSTGDAVAPGNYGLKDMVQALKWNQHNIQYFGGDPNQVTLFGGSSGAVSVHLLSLSNLTNGLFHKYITESGSALYPVNVQSHRAPWNRAFKLGSHFGCPTNTSSSLVECLRSFNASQLVDTNSIFWVWNKFPPIIWNPTVEPDIEGALLTDTPSNLIAAGKIRDLPWITLVTRDEGIVGTALFYENPDLFQELLDNLDLMLPVILQYDSLVDNVAAYTAALKSYYLNDLSVNRSLLLSNFTKLLTDAYFTHTAYTTVQQHLIHAKSPQYLCSFEYRGTVSYSYFFSGGSTTNWGVVHGDELLYLLPGPDAQFGPPGWEFSRSDWDMVEIMVQLWTSFAINGTPSTSNQDGTLVWDPYSSRKNYLQIGNGPDTTLEVKHGFLVDRMRFWKELTAATSILPWLQRDGS